MKQSQRLHPWLAGLAAGLLLASPAWSEGHGPSFVLATPTLGQGQWSSDTVLMGMRTEDGSTPTAIGQMFGYGLHEDLQINLKLPVARSGGDEAMKPLNMRAGMMGAPRNVEASLMWRFHRQAPAIGTRRESTLHLGVASPRQDERRGLEIGESLHAAVATGYASRSTYWWLSAGWQHQRERGDDRLGDLYYAGAVFGYRPGRFRADGAPLDLRWFVEGVVEFPRADRQDGQRLDQTGGRRVLLGPSFLALGGPWGLSGGVLIPVHEYMGDMEPEERARVKLIATYWF
jgi:hypothetical protein